MISPISMANALLGGVLIGLSSLVWLAFKGRVMGVSGIVGELSTASKGDRLWRVAFLMGLAFAGLGAQLYQVSAFNFDLDRSLVAIVGGGVLVGFGARLANGCTSGHGICGVSRLSPRSWLATGLFMATGALTVALIRVFGGGAV